MTTAQQLARTRELTAAQQADRYQEYAHRALDGRDPHHGWSLPGENGYEEALPYAVLTGAAQQAVSNERLAGLDDRLAALGIDLARIAEAHAAQPAPDPTGKTFREEIANVEGKITRADTKASIMLAAVAIGASSLATQAHTILRQPWPVTLIAGIAILLIGTAAWLLLDVVLPKLGVKKPDDPTARASFVIYAQCGDDRQTLRRVLGPDADLGGQLRDVARIAVAKFQLLSRAGLLLKLAGLLLLTDLALAVRF